MKSKQKSLTKEELKEVLSDYIIISKKYLKKETRINKVIEVVLTILGICIILLLFLRGFGLI